MAACDKIEMHRRNQMSSNGHARRTAPTDEQVLSALKAIRNGKHEVEHRINAPAHPFPARMPLSIALTLIKSLSRSGDVVLDPMVGSGTTLVAAKHLGRIGLGLDLDPLAVQLARAATISVDVDAVQRAKERVYTRASAVTPRELARLGRRNAELNGDETAFLNYWFPKKSQRELLALSLAIRKEPHSETRTILWNLFSSLIIAKSNGVSYALDLAHSRPHKDTEKIVKRPLDRWAPQFKRLIDRLPFARELENDGQVGVYLGDARRLPLRSSTVDLIITSPPYLDAIDYIRAHKFALVWLGHRLSKLREVRGKLIGTERGIRDQSGLPDKLEERLRRLVDGGPRQARVRRYLLDLLDVLRECSRVLKSGGLAVVALGPFIISRKRSDASRVVGRLAAQAQLAVVGAVTRRLDDSRRALPPPGKVGRRNSLRRRMEGEVYLALRRSKEAAARRRYGSGKRPG